MVKKNGLWCLDINQNTPGKSVKSSEARLIPLHLFITNDLNFIGYVQGLGDKEGNVFLLLKKVRCRHSHNVGRWFRQFRIRAGIEAAKGNKTFHSFRHTLINHLKQKGVQETYIAELVGHKIESMTMGRYGKQYQPEVLFEQTIKQLDYGIDLSHLKKSKYIIK